jgi:tRNA nucleotidyltransferase (CCA-adding enzyme)
MSSDPRLATALERIPLEPLRRALGELDAYLVGGSVRELVSGVEPAGDLDVAVDGELDPVLERLGVPATRHARFETATVDLDGQGVDLARTRAETYPHPGALPEVEPASIDRDLGRRDFTVNAMALRLREPVELLDPFGGRADLGSGVLRVLHDDSFTDDPTRAIRAARYAARLGLEPDEKTLGLLRRTDLDAVSADRRDAELARLAAEDEAARGFDLLARWGLLALAPGTVPLIDAVDRLSGEPPWDEDRSTRSRAILLAAGGGERAAAAEKLSSGQPLTPSEAVRMAAGHQPAELLLAAARGADWVNHLVAEWSSVALEIDGDDLLAAGIPEGPAIGIGLRTALERKLDGGLSGGREAELRAALEVAREAI